MKLLIDIKVYNEVCCGEDDKIKYGCFIFIYKCNIWIKLYVLYCSIYGKFRLKLLVNKYKD